MSGDQAQASHVEDDHDELTPGYKAPAQKTLDEIAALDQDDEALQKYKRQLLGDNKIEPPFPNDSRNVIVMKMQLCPEGRDPIELDLTGDLSQVKKNVIVVKEGCQFRIKIIFHVQYEIVSGLRYAQVTYRKGIRVDKDNYMVGSYGPKKETHEYTSPPDEAPKGLISRGNYVVKSRFTDDDKNAHLEWEWSLSIKSDWA